MSSKPAPTTTTAAAAQPASTLMLVRVYFRRDERGNENE
jgi:hypothetical protein